MGKREREINSLSPHQGKALTLMHINVCNLSPSYHSNAIHQYLILKHLPICQLNVFSTECFLFQIVATILFVLFWRFDLYFWLGYFITFSCYFITYKIAPFLEEPVHRLLYRDICGAMLGLLLFYYKDQSKSISFL